MKSAAEMGLEVVDVPRADFSKLDAMTLELADGSVASFAEDAETECPECGRPAFKAKFEEYDQANAPIGRFHKVLCGWCGWVAV